MTRILLIFSDLIFDSSVEPGAFSDAEDRHVEILFHLFMAAPFCSRTLFSIAPPVVISAEPVRTRVHPEKIVDVALGKTTVDANDLTIDPGWVEDWRHAP